jgi:hypothetical protein
LRKPFAYGSLNKGAKVEKPFNPPDVREIMEIRDAHFGKEIQDRVKAVTPFTHHCSSSISARHAASQFLCSR